MNKSTKILITIIGALSIFAGIGLFLKDETTNAYFSIFIGLSLIVTVFLIQPMHEKELDKKKKNSTKKSL